MGAGAGRSGDLDTDPKICKLNKITLEVNENNKIAINFYKKFNFQVDRLVPKYYDNGDGALVMYLDI